MRSLKVSMNLKEVEEIKELLKRFIMKNPNFWKDHYVIEKDPAEIRRNIKSAVFNSGGEEFELIYFEKGNKAPNILISQGSGGHSFVFAELGYLMHLRGYNVFIMPKHGGCTINDLVERHAEATKYVSHNFNDRIGVFSEGLGGFVTFYLALANGHFRSAVYQNSPAILTEKKFQEAIIKGRRKLTLPVMKFLFKISPETQISISSYLNWKDLIDTDEANREIELCLVQEGYLKDPDFDKSYPLSAIMSLLLTPPPRPLSELNIPTMFMVATRGFGGKAYVDYLRELYSRLPSIRKTMIEVNGSVYWMLSHPREAANIICEWFDETL